MDLKLFVRGVDRPEELREYARLRVAKSLDRHAKRIQQATVRLEDETGPRKHKIDKVCSISLHLRTGEIHVREIGKDMLQVLDTALGRARAALGRQISRRKRGIGQG